MDVTRNVAAICGIGLQHNNKPRPIGRKREVS
jgi:hypothetical protein